MSVALVAALVAALLVLLYLKGVFFGAGHRHSLFFASEDGYRPGEEVRAILLTDEAPAELRVACELYPATDDNPVRAIPASIDAAQLGPDGWRSLIRATLPLDARPSFEGGWAFTVEGRTKSGRRILQMEAIILKSP